jgi:hypothetical protein
MGKALTNQADTGHACVKDNVTGLIWEVKTDSGTRGKTKFYRWGGLTAIGRDHDTDSREGDYYDDWNVLVNYANDTDNANDTGGALCGFSDWRVPDKEELRSIVHFGKTEPAIDDNYFPNTQQSNNTRNTRQSKLYWSSSPEAYIYRASDVGNAWVLSFVDGDYDDYNTGHGHGRDEFHYVRLVSDGKK